MDTLQMKKESQVDPSDSTTAWIEPESWMNELWDWTDKYQIRSDSIPREASKLGELDSLKIKSDQITTLPEALCNLVNLKQLWLQCPNLKGLPCSIDQLQSLNYLEVNSDKITDLQTELPESFIQSFRDKKLHISGIPYCQFYTLGDGYNRIAHIALIDINDLWTEKALTELKSLSGVSMVIGLKARNIKQSIATTNSKLVDCIVNCAIEDMKAIKQMINGFFNNGVIDFIAFDYYELYEFVRDKQLYYFSSSASNLDSPSKDESIRQTCIDLVKKLSNDMASDIEGLIVHIESTRELNLDELNLVTEAFIDSIKFNFPIENFYLNNSLVEEAEYLTIKVISVVP